MSSDGSCSGHGYPRWFVQRIPVAVTAETAFEGNKGRLACLSRKKTWQLFSRIARSPNGETFPMYAANVKRFGEVMHGTRIFRNMSGWKQNS